MSPFYLREDTALTQNTGGMRWSGFWDGDLLYEGLVVEAAAAAEFAREPARGAERSMRETFTYKTVGDCAIKADVILCASTRDTLPVAVWDSRRVR